MTTPALFIILPFLVAVVLYVFHKKTRLVMISAISLCAILFLFAFFQDFGGVWKIGPISIEIKTAMDILGRSFSLANQDKFFLCFVYVSSALFFGATRITHVSSRFIPIALAIISLLTSALAVQPFLYSAILVEIAVLISIPLMLEPGRPAGKGVLRFLVFQSLAMPLILFGGWLLGGIQASPSDATRLLQSVLFLGIGFAFWLAVVPFQSWVPQLAQDIHPLVSGFMLGLLPIVTMLIMLDFISGLVWLRESQYLQPTLRLIGTIMIVTTGVWAAIEKDGRRLLGYAVLLESGFALLAVSLQTEVSVLTLFLSFIPRIGALALMALALSIFSTNGITPDLDNLTGIMRRFPFASIAFFFSFLSVAGSPLLGGFPFRLAVLEQLMVKDVVSAVWALIGTITFLFAAIRFFMRLSKPVFENWQRGETIGQVVFLVIGIFVLILFGVLPNLLGKQLTPLFMNLPILR
jgi:formate hydrogenlyase subunit 3/multisubunit Na+/H+ antiporter MnhD subunit